MTGNSAKTSGDASSPLVLFEPDGSGHRFWYVRILAEEHLARGGAAMLLTTTRGLERPEFSIHLTDVCSRGLAVRTVRGPLRTHSLVGSLYYVLRAVSLAKQLSAHLVFCEGDSRVLPIYLLERLRMVAISMSLLIMRPDSSGAVGSMKSFAARGIRRARVLNLRDPLSGVKEGTDVRDPVRVSDVSVRRQREGRPIVVVAGVLDRRKALDLVLPAAAQCGFEVTLAGVLDEQTRRLLETLGRQGSLPVVRCSDRFISDRELDEAIAQGDLVSVVLRSESGSSGILGRSVALGRPVIAGGNQTVVEAVSRSGVGVCAHDLTISSVAAAMQEAWRDHPALLERVAAARDRVDSGTRFYQALVPE